MVNPERGVGKCEQHHLSSYGYPSRPAEPFPFCSQCGNPMIWACPVCEAPPPEDSGELAAALFCRQCGAPYFVQGEETSSR